MKKNYTFLLILMAISYATLAQTETPFMNPIDNNRGNLVSPALGREYKALSHQRGDTLWLPTRLDTYYWNGEELAPDESYITIDYNDSGEWETAYYLDPASNDTLRKQCAAYDDSMRMVSNAWYDYVQADSSWKGIYRSLMQYDNWWNVTENRLQSWDNTQQVWKDSLRKISSYLGYHVYEEMAYEQYVNESWLRYFGIKSVFHYTPEGYVDGQDSYNWNMDSLKYVLEMKNYMLLNENGSFYEYWNERWDYGLHAWINYMKYTDVAYQTYYTYPNYYNNKLLRRKSFWWVDEHWEPYQIDSIRYMDDSLNSTVFREWLWDGVSEWILAVVYNYFCYEDGNKRRATTWWYIMGQGLVLAYDDSLTWTYNKGSLEKMYRIQLDTATGEWNPAALMLYSNFFPFVSSTTITEPPEWQQNNELEIIPNPSGKEVEIRCGDFIEEAMVVNSHGQLCIRKKINGREKKCNFDVSKLSPGVYVVTVLTSGRKAISGKLMVE